MEWSVFAVLAYTIGGVAVMMSIYYVTYRSKFTKEEWEGSASEEPRDGNR